MCSERHRAVSQLPSPGGIRLVLAFECVRSLVKQSSYQTLPILPEDLKSPLGSEEALLVPNNDIRPRRPAGLCRGRFAIKGRIPLVLLGEPPAPITLATSSLRPTPADREPASSPHTRPDDPSRAETEPEWDHPPLPARVESSHPRFLGARKWVALPLLPILARTVSGYLNSAFLGLEPNRSAVGKTKAPLVARGPQQLTPATPSSPLPSVSQSPTGGAPPGDPRRTKRIRNDSSRDQRTVKTNCAACQGDLTA